VSFYRIPEDYESDLIEEPETGMGFHVIQAEAPHLEGDRFVVLASLIVLPARDHEELENSLLSLCEVSSEDIDDIAESAHTISFQGSVRTIESRLPQRLQAQYNQPPLLTTRSRVGASRCSFRRVPLPSMERPI